jgi:serine/threonine protein kinase/Flp pilus assembly protein TadD
LLEESAAALLKGAPMSDPASEQSIFLHALSLPTPADRAAYLDAVCHDRPELRAEIDALLAAHDRLGGGSPPTTGPEPAGPAPPEPASGAGEDRGAVLSGRYKLVEEIGEGGMGTVWMAQQTEPVRRLVAVKLVKAGMDSRQVLARFEAERQALALMDHPNIAKVLDAGTTEAGRPYFVMELVKGVPITKYCDEHRLTPRRRLELFIPVCQAIQHAHQKGIIHRDIKPSNVLVCLYDGKAVPKVIDFGIAKAAGQSLTEHTLVTGFGAVVGTLEYMSPEQAELNQLDIDTRSDIYSLGVLLYELLTGTTPLERKRLKEAALLEVLRVIREEEPPRPSTRLSASREALPSVAAQRQTEPAKLAKLVRGELDWIVMKSLEKDRSRRYETANGFARDIQRYLADEPVEACPPSARYRLGKFVRRNKRGLAAAGLVLLLLMLVGGGAGWLAADRAARQREAEGKILDALEEAGPRLREGNPGDPALLAAVQRVEVQLGGDAVGPEVRRRAEQFLCDVRMLKDLDDARLRLAESKDGAMFDVAGANARYAAAFSQYGIHVLTLDPAEAAARIRSSAIHEALLAGLDGWMQIKGADSMMQWTRGHNPRQEQLQRVADAADDSAWRRDFRAAALAWDGPKLLALAGQSEALAQPPAVAAWLGFTLSDQGDLFDQAAAFLKKAQQRHPTDFWINYQLGWILEKRDRRVAVGYCQVAVAIRPGSAEAHNLLGFCLFNLGALDAAIAAWQQAIALDPRFGLPHRHIGWALVRKGDFKGAEACYKKALELAPKDVNAHYSLGQCLYYQGKLDEAIACYRKALELEPKDDNARTLLRTALAQQGKAAEAEQRAALEGKKLTGILRGDLRPVDAGARAEFARLCQAHGYHAAAARLCEEGYGQLGAPARYLAACAAALAGTGQGKDADKLDEKERARWRKQALAWLRAALEARRKLLENHPGKARDVSQTLRHWLDDPDLNGVRDQWALAGLPEPERRAWQELWQQVKALYLRVAPPRVATRPRP